MGGHRACRTIASWAGVVSLFLPSVVLTGNCNAKNVAGPISGALRHHAALAVPPRCCKKCCWTYFALGRASPAVRSVVGSIHLFRPPVVPRACEKCCWTYFTLGRASAAVKNIVGPIPPFRPRWRPSAPPPKMLLDLFHSRPRQRCCKECWWTYSAPTRLSVGIF